MCLLSYRTWDSAHLGLIIIELTLVKRYIISQRYQTSAGQLSPEPWINISIARSQAALTCVQYLTLGCFKQDLTDNEVRDFVHQGYYCFQDYAVVYWYDHVELSLSAAMGGGIFVNSLLPALNIFLARSWNRLEATEKKKKDKSVPIKIVQQLKVLQDDRFPEVFRRLVVLGSAREKPSPLEFLNFRIPIGRARALLESQHEPDCSTTQVQVLQQFYGHAFNDFKCRQESCFHFSWVSPVPRSVRGTKHYTIGAFNAQQQHVLQPT